MQVMREGSDEQGKVCVDQIFAIKMLVDGYLGKNEELLPAFMD